MMIGDTGVFRVPAVQQILSLIFCRLSVFINIKSVITDELFFNTLEMLYLPGFPPVLHLQFESDQENQLIDDEADIFRVPVVFRVPAFCLQCYMCNLSLIQRTNKMDGDAGVIRVPAVRQLLSFIFCHLSV